MIHRLSWLNVIADISSSHLSCRTTSTCCCSFTGKTSSLPVLAHSFHDSRGRSATIKVSLTVFAVFYWHLLSVTTWAPQFFVNPEGRWLCLCIAEILEDVPDSLCAGMDGVDSPLPARVGGWVWTDLYWCYDTKSYEVERKLNKDLFI